MAPMLTWGFPGGSVVKNSSANAGDSGSIPGLGRYPGERNGKLPTPVFLPGKLDGPRSLAGYSSWGHKRVGHNLATKQQQSMFPNLFKPEIRKTS